MQAKIFNISCLPAESQVLGEHNHTGQKPPELSPSTHCPEKTLSATASPESAISVQSCWHPGHFPLPLCTLSWFLTSIHEDSRSSFPTCTRANAFMWSCQHPTIKSGAQPLTHRPAPTSEPMNSQWQHGGPQAAGNTLQTKSPHSPSFTAPMVLVWAWGAAQDLCVLCQNFGKGHHTIRLTVPKATLQLVSAVLKGRLIMQFY